VPIACVYSYYVLCGVCLEVLGGKGLSCVGMGPMNVFAGPMAQLLRLCANHWLRGEVLFCPFTLLGNIIPSVQSSFVGMMIKGGKELDCVYLAGAMLLNVLVEHCCGHTCWVVNGF